jgi:hypothetical protein
VIRDVNTADAELPMESLQPRIQPGELKRRFRQRQLVREAREAEAARIQLSAIPEPDPGLALLPLTAIHAK